MAFLWHKTKHFFKKEIPVPHNRKTSITTGVIFGLFIVFFLGYFQPYGLNKLVHTEKMLSVFMYGFITFVVVAANTHWWSGWCTKKHNGCCRIAYQLLATFLILFQISLFNWLFTYSTFEQTPFSFSDSFISVVILGFIPMVFMIILTELLRMKRALKKEIHNQQLPNLEMAKSAEANNQLFVFENYNRKESLQIRLTNLLYIEAQDNYCNFVIEQANGSTEKHLLRLSLKSAYEQLSAHRNFLRCHRSYIINILQIKAVSGNAQALRFILKHQNIEIPVSRSFPKAVVEQIKQHHTQISNNIT